MGQAKSGEKMNAGENGCTQMEIWLVLLIRNKTNCKFIAHF